MGSHLCECKWLKNLILSFTRRSLDNFVNRGSIKKLVVTLYLSRFNIKKFMCFIFISPQTVIISLSCTNWLSSIIERGCVYYTAWAECLTFKQLGWYLNFGMCFMKNVLFEHKKIINKMPHKRSLRIQKKNYRPTSRTNQGRPLKSLLDVWDWSRSTSGPMPCHLDYYYYYYYHHHHHHQISPFSALAGKYSPILGCSNQQD